MAFLAPGEDLGSRVVNHVVWADNIWVLAKTREELEVMVQELTEIVYGAALSWKTDSLKILASEQVDLEEETDLTVWTGETHLSYDWVETLEILRELLVNGHGGY